MDEEIHALACGLDLIDKELKSQRSSYGMMNLEQG